MTSSSGFSASQARTASSSWARLGVERPSVARFEPSTTTGRRGMLGSVKHLARWRGANGGRAPRAGALQPLEGLLDELVLLVLMDGLASRRRAGRRRPAHVPEGEVAAQLPVEAL